MTRGMQETRPMNRTGAALKPEPSHDLAQVTEATPPSSPGDGRLIAVLRNDYSGEGELIGHAPKSPAKAAGRASKKAMRHEMLLDKMGERLAFERTGVRLYEALLAKYDAPSPIGPSGASRPDRGEIEHICAEEHEHFMMLSEAISSMGGDPTALTPSANVAYLISSGLPKVLLDPRTTFQQCLEAILVAELADNDAWTMLEELAQAEGLDDLVTQFAEAREHEREHLDNVRRWLAEGTLAGGAAKAQG